jgi:formiminotetrahydrofolate cyclodeaminase
LSLFRWLALAALGAQQQRRIDVTRDWTSQTLGQYLADLGSSAPAPGGGSAAALAGALSAALGHMVVSVAADKEATPERVALRLEFERLEGQLLAFASDDERAFTAVMDALRLPKDDPARAEQLQGALAHAADVPLRAAETALSLFSKLREAEGHASRAIVSDVGVAAHLAFASLSSSLLNVRVNQRALTDARLRDHFEVSAADLHASAEAAHADIVRRIAERLAPASR